MMYITKIQLRDVRCFEEAVIDLSEYEPGTSVLIAGNNGLGKSAILRAIAMGLCDRDSAASLLRELKGTYIRKQAKRIGRKGKKQATIEIDLLDEQHKSWKIKTTIEEWKENIIERVEQYYPTKGRKKEFENFSSFWGREGLFVTAYGAGLRTEANAKFADYFAPDAVYSLFKYDAPLQDPETAWRRQLAAVQKADGKITDLEAVNKIISDLLKYVLNLDDKAEIKLEPNGIFIKEKNELIELDAMGDGHQSLIKITLDILLWYLLKINYDEEEKGEDRNWKPIHIDDDGIPDVRGIVIIDEIEQHLHPKLQRQILKRLHEKFPKVQFIMTTHSPLCVSGTADTSEKQQEKYKIYSIFKSENGKVQVEKKPVPYGFTSDQILIDYFDLYTTLSVSLEEDYKRLRTLLLKGRRNKLEEKEFQELKKKVAEMAPVLGETIEEREMLVGLKNATEELAQYMRTTGHDKK